LIEIFERAVELVDALPDRRAEEEHGRRRRRLVPPRSKRGLRVAEVAGIGAGPTLFDVAPRKGRGESDVLRIGLELFSHGRKLTRAWIGASRGEVLEHEAGIRRTKRLPRARPSDAPDDDRRSEEEDHRSGHQRDAPPDTG